MSEILCETEPKKEESEENKSDVLSVDASVINSPTLARLIDEVRNEETHTAYAYNRMHNRHNRSR